MSSSGQYVMPPRPYFFLVRPDVVEQDPTDSGQTQLGQIVPLIAVDELPEWLDIVGVPRELTAEQTVGLCNLGTIPRSEGAFPVRITTSTPDVLASPPASWAEAAPATLEESERQRDLAKPAVEGKGADPASARNALKRQQSEATGADTTGVHPASSLKIPRGPECRECSPAGLQKSIHNVEAQSASQQQREHEAQPPKERRACSPMTYPDSNKTTSQTVAQSEYCRHWCHHGTCKWGIRCRYLHAMLTTHEGLGEVELREVPQWWVVTMLQGAGGSPGMLAAPDRSLAVDQDSRGPLFHPLDVRLNAMHQLGLLGSNSNRRLRTQRREAMALPDRLGLSPPASGRQYQRKARELTPLDKGRNSAKREAAMATAAVRDRPVPAGSNAHVACQVAAQQRAVGAEQENTNTSGDIQTQHTGPQTPGAVATNQRQVLSHPPPRPPPSPSAVMGKLVDI